MARCLEDNELSEFLEVLGAAQEVGYNLDEHYGKEVGCFFLRELPETETKTETECRLATKPFCIWPLMRTTLTQRPLWRPALR